MCGRFTLHNPETRIRDDFHLEHTEPLGLTPRFNIATSQDIPIIRDSESSSEMVLTKRGLVPAWSKEPMTKYSTINARLESVTIMAFMALRPTDHSPLVSLIVGAWKTNSGGN